MTTLTFPVHVAWETTAEFSEGREQLRFTPGAESVVVLTKADYEKVMAFVNAASTAAPVSLPVIPRAKLDELEALAVKMHDNRILSGSIGPLMNAGFADGSQVSAGMLRKWIAEQSADAVAVSGETT